jgi:NAD(P)-dependent dehydrogenase (short-subunit alcohol dehydrogenase family)
MDLEGTVGVVTGGGTGIGRSVSLALARARARAVAVNYSRSSAEAETTADDVRKLGAEAVVIKADVADEGQVLAGVAEVVDRYGRLDVLVNSAGVTRFIAHADLDGLTDEVWRTILGVNVMGTFYFCRAAAAELKKARGAIVNVASIAGFRAAGSSIPYGVSKAGVIQLTRGLAVALAPEVRVNAVAPGLVSTRWFRDAFGEETAAAQEQRLAGETPLQAVATADDVAVSVLALLATDFVTGQCVIVDGGKSLKY